MREKVLGRETKGTNKQVDGRDIVKMEMWLTLPVPFYGSVAHR